MGCVLISAIAEVIKYFCLVNSNYVSKVGLIIYLGWW
jgi:hypothetical protein